MGLFKRLAEKPWLVPAEGSVESLRSSEFSVHNRKVALVVFLAIIGVLFFLFFAAYHMRILLSTDWVAAPEPPLLWINTVVLIICSGAFEFSRNTARRGQLERTRTWFLIAGVLTLVFLATDVMDDFHVHLSDAVFNANMIPQLGSGNINVLALNYGDVNFNDDVQAYDASLILQYLICLLYTSDAADE